MFSLDFLVVQVQLLCYWKRISCFGRVSLHVFWRQELWRPGKHYKAATLLNPMYCSAGWNVSPDYNAWSELYQVRIYIHYESGEVVEFCGLLQCRAFEKREYTSFVETLRAAKVSEWKTQARIDCLEVVYASKIEAWLGLRYLWGLASSARPRKKVIGALGILVEYRQDRATATLSVRHGWATRKGKRRNKATGWTTVRQGPSKSEIRFWLKDDQDSEGTRFVRNCCVPFLSAVFSGVF